MLGAALQWGHRLSAMETSSNRRQPTSPSQLQWGHRLSAMETCRLGPAVEVFRRFNGATAFQRWKLEEHVEKLKERDALQWGHRLSAMETGTTRAAVTPLTVLQWGHRLSAMETFLVQFLDVAVAHASMGPPPFSDGNPRCNEMGEFETVLQWGHRLSAMETYQYQFPGHPGDDASMGPPPFSDGNSCIL